MSVEDDARRAVHALLRREIGTFGPFELSQPPYSVLHAIKRNSFWLVGWSGGDLVWFAPFRGMEHHDPVFDAVEEILGVTLVRGPGVQGVLGPLGLAALRAHLATTTVVEQ